MDAKSILQILINETEKVFRLIIPGFLFVVLFKFAFPILFGELFPKFNIVAISFIALIVGSCVYALHRIVCEIFDTIYYKKDYCKIAKILIYNSENKDKYLLFKWASIHLPLIVSELFIFFSICNAPDSSFDEFWWKTLIVFGFFMIVSIAAYYFMHRIQEQIYIEKKIIESNKTVAPDRGGRVV